MTADLTSTILASLGAPAGMDLDVPEGLDPGRVSIVHGALVDVIFADASGIEHEETFPTGTIEPHPVAGDWVGVTQGTIAWVRPRSSQLRRPETSKRRVQILAANLDLVLVVIPIDRPLNLQMLESFSVMAWDSGAEPVVVLTKADGADDVQAQATEAAVTLPGIRQVVTSAETGLGLDEVSGLLGPGTTAVMLGASGVGKTTLLNVLDDRDEFVRPVGPHGEGRHSTTTRKLHRLASGGVLLDIPGIRLLDVVVSAQGLAETFPDIEELGTTCRFADCRHRGDEGCAVLAAVADGSLDERRFESWRRIRTAMAEQTVEPRGEASGRSRRPLRRRDSDEELD